MTALGKVQVRWQESGRWMYGFFWCWECKCCMEGDDFKTWREAMDSAYVHAVRPTMWHENTPGAFDELVELTEEMGLYDQPEEFPREREILDKILEEIRANKEH